MTARDTTRSATNPDQPKQDDNVAVNDRSAARGADYADDDNASAEGNDAALTAGPAFVRRVNPDGTVQAVPATPHGDAQSEANPADPNPEDRAATAQPPTTSRKD